MIQDMLDALENPAMRHAATVHLPIALSMLGVLFALATAIFSKSTAMRVTAILVFAAFAASAWFAVQTGEDAEHALPNNLLAAASEHIEEHEHMAAKIWLYAGCACGLLLLSAIPTPIVRRGAAWLAAVGAVFIAGWVAVTAHHGGTAVYDYAVGTANPVIITDTQPPRETESGVVASAPNGARELSPQEAFFVASVRPILETNCMRCHNERRARRSGGLDQTTRQAIMIGGNSGPALVPGKPDESAIFLRVIHEDDETRMPPGEALSAEEIEALRQWIADGAVWVENEES